MAPCRYRVHFILHCKLKRGHVNTDTNSFGFELTCLPLFGPSQAMFTLSPVLQQVLLNIICEEQGFPSNCSEKSATSAMAEWGATQSVVSGLVLLLTLGFWTVISDRIGRRGALIFSSFGVLAYVLGFVLVMFFSSLMSHWRLVVLGAVAFNSLLGSFMVTLLAVFGQCGDLTETEPQMRGWLFALIEGLMGATGIVGAAISTMGEDFDRKWIILGCFVCCCVLFVYALFVFPETISPTVQSKPINWRRANIVGSLIFCCMTKSTRESLEEDAMVLYKKRLEAHFGGKIPDDIRNEDIPRRGEDARALISEAEDPIVADAEDGIPLTSAISRPNKRGNAAAKTEGLTTSLLSSSDSSNVTNSSSDAPNYIKPNNSIFILSINMAIGFIVLVSYQSVRFPFLMDNFDTTAKEFGQILCVEYLAKGFGTFVLVPLVIPWLSTPMKELRAMMIAYAVQGVFFVLMPMAGNLILLTACFAGQSIVSCFTLGFSRGLITNQTSNDLQGRILGLTCGLEVITMIVGGFASSYVYSVTNLSNPGLVFQAVAVLQFIAAVVPFFITDTSYEFNNRNPKVHNAPTEGQDAKKGDPTVSEDTQTCADLGLGLDLHITEPPVVIAGEYSNAIN